MSMNSSQVAGKRQLEASVEQTKAEELKRQKIEEEKSDVGFWETGPGGLALGNPFVLEKIFGFLNVNDICHWYDSSQTFKNKIDQMGDIFWKREAQNLATVLKKKKEDSLEEKWPGKTMRDIFLILKSDVERLVAEIKAMFDPHHIPLKVTHIADAAILAYYGFLGSLRSLNLKNVYRSSIPIDEHLASLVACVKDNVTIDRYSTDLLATLDNVQCECVSIAHLLNAEECLALVRAMKTRVRKLCISICSPGLFGNLYKELKKYDGKGKCEQVDFLNMNYVKLQYRHFILLWVKDCKWQILADEIDFLSVIRKES